MKYTSMAFAIVIVTACQGAATMTETDKEMATWQPLWADGVPDKAIVHKDPPKATDRDKKGIGEPYRAENISLPLIKLFPAPKETATGAAVVVFPGGGYKFISVGPEGYTVARKLNSMGISAAVVMYRTLPTEPNGTVAEATWKTGLPAVLEDGKRAVRMVRNRAAEFGVDSNKIGTMGFSAGGHLCAMLMLDTEYVNVDSADPLDKVSARPDFTCLIYSGFSANIKQTARPDIGPCFLAMAANDKFGGPQNTIDAFMALQKAKVPSELHVFQSGGHGFNIGKTKGTESTWPELFGVWLRQNSFSRN